MSEDILKLGVGGLEWFAMFVHSEGLPHGQKTLYQIERCMAIKKTKGSPR